MHYTEPIYRPPIEEDDIFIQVTRGCSHNSCAFCGQYKNTTFKTSPRDEVKADIMEVAKLYPDKKRVYLLSGDPFCLSFERLQQIGVWLNEYIPGLEDVAMFASIRSIMSKTDDELRRLKSLKMETLYPGIETGDPEVLAFANKGHTVEQALEQLGRLDRLGINYAAAYIAGLTGAGEERALRNARNTATFFNQVHPMMLGVTSLSIWDETPIGEMRKNGTFTPAPEVQMLKETRELLAGLNTATFFSSIHVSNMFPVNGRLPQDKARMLVELDHHIADMEKQGDVPRFTRDGFM